MKPGGRTGVALVVSAALHGAVVIVLPFWTRDPPPVRSAPVVPSGELVQVELFRTGGQPEAPTQPIRRAPPLRERPHAEVVREPIAPAPMPGGSAVAVGEQQAPRSEDAAAPADETAGATAGTTGGSPIAGGDGAREAGAASASGSGSRGDDAYLGIVHTRLAEAARRCYPPAARRYRLTGEVQVSFCLDGRGGVTQVEARRSSGSSLLDRAAVDCVVPGAAPLPGPSTCVSVAVQFKSER